MNFLDLYFKEVFEWGIVQTDPHLGNYRIRVSPDGNDQLVLLDFGAVRTYQQDFLIPYYKMLKSSLQGDLKKLEEAVLELKFLSIDDSPELKKIFVEFCTTTIEPFAGGVYDWKTSTLPQRLTKMGFQMIQQFKIGTPPREVLFLDRKTGGVFIFLAVLNARVDGRPLLNNYIEKI